MRQLLRKVLGLISRQRATFDELARNLSIRQAAALMSGQHSAYSVASIGVVVESRRECTSLDRQERTQSSNRPPG
jgi:hypothetical protein